jgi:hypothetical protein
MFKYFKEHVNDQKCVTGNEYCRNLLSGQKKGDRNSAINDRIVLLPPR